VPGCVASERRAVKPEIEKANREIHIGSSPWTAPES
jgi:hypothetical protein